MSPLHAEPPSGREPIGILGGTFDPVHHGHLRLALELREQLGLERVHLVPAGVPVHRPAPRASAEQRCAMLERAVAGVPELVVDDRELRRPGPSFMVETLADFRREFSDRPLCLLLGMDAFGALDTWYRWRDVLDLAHMGVARRPGADVPAEGLVGAVVRERLSHDPRALHEARFGCIAFGDLPALDISSTRIRTLIAEGRRARYLLPHEVLDYIRREELYAYAK